VSGPIVLGYDASESAQAALGETVTLAKELGAEVIVVFGYYISPLGGGDMRDYKTALERVGTEAVDEAVGRLEAAGVKASSRLVSDKPADAIIRVARDEGARMVVVGTVGEGPITGAILGSVVLKLVQRCPIPMLVVPAPN
jgi:nucleotide-binding universal stress UspA family protein